MSTSPIENAAKVSYQPRIAGGALVYSWTEGSAAGSGKFTLAVGGDSFAGWWNSGDDPNVAQNSWNGTRK